MRVIAGSHRGRRLSGPQGTALRPTSDKVRGALFSILGNRIPGSRFLDLFAGSGAVGIEALSRGAATVTFVESDQRAVRLLRKNLIDCQLLSRADVRSAEVDLFLSHQDWKQSPFDVIFADPPYAAIQELAPLWRAWEVGLIGSDGVMVIEQDAKAQLPPTISGATLIRRYRYGDTALFVYGAEPHEASNP